MDSSGTVEQDCCQVCRSSKFDDNVFEKLVCKECKRIAHKFCYAPDIRDKKNFRCDQCKKGRAHQCTFCLKSTGILKNVGQRTWAHVLCGLSSPKIKLQSYKSLELKIIRQLRDQGQLKKCMICLKQSVDVFQCWNADCKNYVHVGCIVSYKFLKGQEFYLTFGLLDKHNNIMMNQLRDYKEKFESFKFMRYKKIRPVICIDHNDDPHFIFCSCNKSNFRKGNPQKILQVSCNNCKRWFHLSCTKIQDPERQDFDCVGCKDNDLFKKGAHLPELIQRMVVIQTEGTVNKDKIKFLDSCILRFSGLINEICMRKSCIQEINKYYYRKVLQRIYLKEKHNSKQSIKYKQSKIIEILYLLTKHTFLQYRELNNQKIEQIIYWMSKDTLMFGLQSETLARYKSYLQSKLNKTQNPPTQVEPPSNQIYSELTFYKEGRERISPQPIELMAKQTRQLLDKLQRNELANKAYKHSRENHLFEILFKSHMTQEHLKITFNKLRRIFSLKEQGYITQTECVQLIDVKNPEFTFLNSEKKTQLSSFYMQKIKNYNIIPEFQHQQKLLSRALKKITAGLAPRETCLIRKDLVGNLVYLAADSQLCLSDYSDIFFSIKKRKLLKCISAPIQDEIQEVTKEVKAYLADPSLPYNFSKEEKKIIDKYFNRSRFYLRIVNQEVKLRGDSMDYNNQEDQQELEYQKICSLGGMQFLQMQAFQAMQNWAESKIAINAAFRALFDLSQSEVQFTNAQRQVVSQFAKKILDNFLRPDRQQQSITATIEPANLKRLMTVINYFDFQQHYRFISAVNKSFYNWKKQLEEHANISQALENPHIIMQLYKLFSDKINQTYSIALNLTAEVRKLKAMRLWTVISKKILIDCDRIKLSLSSAQQLKSLLQISKYPQNKVRNYIQKLNMEAVDFKAKMKFSKQRMPADIQIYKQMTFLKQKSKIEDAELLIKQMKASQLELLCQITELEELISQFRQKMPSNLKQWADSQDSSLQIETMRKFILESPFVIPDMDHYQHMYRKMYVLKCQQAQDSMSQKQFYRMLTFGGEGAVRLFQKFPGLLQAYKSIETAKKQILELNPDFNRLLPSDMKKLKTTLMPDTHEVKLTEKLYNRSRSLRQKFTSLKKNREPIERFVQLMGEISRQPVNMNEVGLQFVKMKTDLEGCLETAKNISHQENYDSKNVESLILKYKLNGIKHQKMEHFEKIAMQFRAIIDKSSILDKGNYYQFHQMCEQFKQIDRIENIRKIRESGFHRMYASYMETKQKQNQFGKAIVKEGAYLIKRNPANQQIFNKMRIAHEKLAADLRSTPKTLLPAQAVILNPSLQNISESDQIPKESSSLKSSQGYLDDLYPNEQDSSQASRKARMAPSLSGSEINCIDY